MTLVPPCVCVGFQGCASRVSIEAGWCSIVPLRISFGAPTEELDCKYLQVADCRLQVQVQVAIGYLISTTGGVYRCTSYYFGHRQGRVVAVCMEIVALCT